ncbi:MAG TPA: alpha/beta fold hydrolase [Ilumatobacteraceae bacterium]
MLRSILLCGAVLAAGACSTKPDAGPEPGASSIVAAAGAPTGAEIGSPTTALSPSAPPSPSVAAVPVSCPDGFDDADECYAVELPADRTDPAAGSVVLPVAIARATGPNPQHRAVVVPAGGPGFAGLDDIDYFGHVLPFLETHDIVTYDQRGTGRATPLLECPERDEVAVATLQEAGAPGDERAAVAAAMLACRERLVAAGVDFDDYDSEVGAADLDALRSALGYDRWTILGISYGGRLALATMRSFPDGIESAILDSVYDVTYGGLAETIASANRGIDHLAAACAADPSCASDYPDLAATIERVRDRYNASPWEGDIVIDDGSPPEPFVITGDDIMTGIFQALYDTSLVPALPSVIVALDGGDTSTIPLLLVESIPRITGLADAMGLTFDCADNAGLTEVAAADEALLAEPENRMSTAITMSYAPTCVEWDVPPTSEHFNDPVVSPIPALVLAGSFDPITPPAGTEAVAAQLERATFALFPANGHGVTGRGECQTVMMQAFLADPTAPVDTSCVAGLIGPAWI